MSNLSKNSSAFNQCVGVKKKQILELNMLVLLFPFENKGAFLQAR